MRRIVVAAAVLALMGVQDLSPASALATKTDQAVQAAPDAGATTAAIPVPTPTPARPGKPTKLVVLGDSISQSTGTGEIAQEHPVNSWATGTGVNSVANRLGIAAGNRFNLSKNGAEMDDIENEYKNGKSGGSGDVPPAPADTGLVLIEIGGNDLCADSVAAMTPTASYRSLFVSALAQIKRQSPDALIQVMSVPDIYNLWYIRGAPHDPVYHPEPESDQAGGIGYNGARFYWSQSWFPCHSLLDNPGSYAQADRDRRQAVRQRDKEYNAVLKEECAKVLRCRFDNNMLFDFTSNRVTPPDGPLKPETQWLFNDYDISRNEGSGKLLCPASGLFDTHCGDHFHPSIQGQGKIADAATAAGRDWNDTTYPTATASVTSPAQPGPTYRGRAIVHFGGTDAAGIRGQEVRVYQADGTVTPWDESVGLHPDIKVTTLGTNYVEVRSHDNNGNRSAGTILPITITPPDVPEAPGAPTVKGTDSGLEVTWTPPTDDGGADITLYAMSSLVDSPGTTVGVMLTGGTSALTAGPVPGRVIRFKAAAQNSVGTGAASAASAPTVAPFGSLSAFVTQQYKDFAGRSPTSTELSSHVAKLADGTEYPTLFVQSLIETPYWDGAYGTATRLYKAYFLRIPDPSGLDYWARQRRAGRTLDSISQQFAKSSEFARRYGTLNDHDFVEQLYKNVFSRDPDASGLDFYVRRLQAGWSRGRVVLQLSESSENIRKMAPTVGVVEVVRGMLGRAPTAAEITSLSPAYVAGQTPNLVTEVIAGHSYTVRVYS